MRTAIDCVPKRLRQEIWHRHPQEDGPSRNLKKPPKAKTATQAHLSLSLWGSSREGDGRSYECFQVYHSTSGLACLSSTSRSSQTDPPQIVIYRREIRVDDQVSLETALTDDAREARFSKHWGISPQDVYFPLKADDRGQTTMDSLLFPLVGDRMALRHLSTDDAVRSTDNFFDVYGVLDNHSGLMI